MKEIRRKKTVQIDLGEVLLLKKNDNFKTAEAVFFLI